MKILMAASEMAPLARTGGLGDVLQSLPGALEERGHEVTVVLPLYRSVRENPALQLEDTGVRFTLQVGSKRPEAEIWQCTLESGIQVFLVRRDEYFDRSGLYGADGRDYSDNAERFIFFSKAVVELAQRITPPPDILHAHDWQAALVPAFIKDRALPFQSMLTIHNIAYQGSFWGVDFGLTNLPGSYFSARGVEFHGSLNFLKGGVMYADAITTVSEHYAQEIQTPESGAGLDAVMRENSSRLTGILNGADYRIWNPATDKFLPKKFKSGTLAGKKACRKALLTQLRLDENPRGPVFAMVTRLAEQKGLDLVIPLLDRLLADDVRLVILGEGESEYERELSIAVRQHRNRFAFVREFDNRLAHLIEGGADATLIPSHFEPCGLSAMYSLKYGTIPIARACGGLYQIIRDFDPGSASGNGFLFYDYTAEALWDAIGRAKRVFTDEEAWKGLIQRAMAADFSWSHAAARYEEIYTRLLAAAASPASAK
ncbi:MAG: glycogen synthase GlgA [Verrucomicrobiota bacterium]|nr:glycogen synthase GlgA [Verrucomicrobiota bacterium]